MSCCNLDALFAYHNQAHLLRSQAPFGRAWPLVHVMLGRILDSFGSWCSVVCWLQGHRPVLLAIETNTILP